MPETSNETQMPAGAAETIAEGRRVMTICNACRYCEGYCAVFPAMMRRKTFSDADVTYLAHLCHGCNGCYYACQYAPPHDFAVNIPRTFAERRKQTYAEYTWPGAFAGLFDRAGPLISMMLAIGLGAMFLVAHSWKTPAALDGSHGGNFYAVIPHTVMAWSFGLVFLYAVGVLLSGFLRFRRHINGSGADSVASAATASVDAVTLKYLGGGGDGCNYPAETFSQVRRVFHQLTFWGFLLCFAATCVGTIYHYAFGWIAPYGYASLPVVLGTLGGIGLLVGPAGLLWLKVTADPEPQDVTQRGMDSGFLMLLFLTAASGLGLLAWRETDWLAPLLAVHLGIVLALFLTLPYGKFVHAGYRYAALLRNAREQRGK